MQRSLIIALGGAAALALSAMPALADGYARGQAGAPQARHHSSGGHHAARGHRTVRAHTSGHRWNAAASSHGSVSSSHGYRGVGYPSARVEERVIVRRSGGYGGVGYGGVGYGADYGYGGYGYDHGPAYGYDYALGHGRPASQSSYFDYRYRTGQDGVRQGFGREVGYALPYGQGGYRGGYQGGGDYGYDRGGRYGYSDGDRYASSRGYDWSSSGGYGDYGYTGSDYGRDWSDDGRERGDRDRDRDWDDRHEHQDRDGRRWECSCRETWR